MAWKHGFVIDYVEGDGKGLSCSKCRHFDEDKSCRVTGQRMPEVGYDCWRNCRWFELSAKHETARNRKALESFCERRGFGFDEWDPKKAAKLNKDRSKAIKAAAKARRVAEIESFGLAPGSTVNSRKRGEGVIVSLGKKTVTVSFGGDHATFPYPSAFLNGGLSIGKARPSSAAKPAQPKAAASDMARIVPGATVSHMTFGYGIVQSVAAGEARISFDGDKEKIVPIEKAVAARELKPVAPRKQQSPAVPTSLLTGPTKRKKKARVSQWAQYPVPPRDAIIPGRSVIHKKQGPGEIIFVDEYFITIMFEKPYKDKPRMREFPFPAAFKQGTLRLDPGN